MPLVPAAAFFPPFSIVQGHFYSWRDEGIFDRMLDALRDATRVASGRSDGGGHRQPERPDNGVRRPERL